MMLVWLDDARRDFRYAARSLAGTRGFTAVAVLTLALGIGANTGIFSIVHAVVMSPLPFKSPERLVRLYENVPAGETPNLRAIHTGIYAHDLLELQMRSRMLSHVATHGAAMVTVRGGADAARQELSSVSAATFPMLGVQPIIGRWFAPEDDTPGLDRIIILSYGAWQRYFGGDPHLLGKTLTFNGDDFGGKVVFDAPYTVVAVMPTAFHFPNDQAQFWIPFAVSWAPGPHPSRIDLIARLVDGVSPETAAAEVTEILQGTRGVARGSYVHGKGPPRFELVRVQDEVTASVKPAILVLTVAVGCVLLIACANVANLLLARTAARQREIAVRVAIGAGRSRLVRQVLTESVLLSMIGGTIGTALASAGVRLFRVLATNLARVDLGSTSTTFPRLDAIGIDASVFAFAAAVSVGTGLLFGLAPALRYSRAGQMDILRSAAGSTAGRSDFGYRDTARGALVVAEIALATVLLVAGGLLIRSFVRLARVDLGYDPANVLTFQVSMPGSKRPTQQLKASAEDLVARVQLIPGVQAAAYANQLPMVQLQNAISLRTTPAPPAGPPSPDSPDVRLVSRNYLHVMGIRVTAGRAFGANDGAGQPGVLLINERLARREFGDRNPVGTTVYLGRTAVPWEIVGVVENVRQRGLDQEPRPQLFVDLRQWSGPAVPIFPIGTYYGVRTTADPTSLVAAIREIVQQHDRGATLENVATMGQIVSNAMTVPRMYAVLLGMFAGVAITLAAAGIYGVVAYSVTQRTREIGIRMALGAQRAEVLRLVLGQSAVHTMVGIVIGLIGATAVTGYLKGLLFGLTPLDPATFVAVAMLFGLVATLAAYVPARHATGVDPLVALRCD